MLIRRKGAITALATIVVAALLFAWNQQRLASFPEVDVPIESLPKDLGDWKGQDTAGLSVRSQDILQLTRYVKRSYVKDGKSVLLYIGYWKAQTGEYQAAKHSPELCLPSNGWNIERRGAKQLAFPTMTPAGVTTKRILGDFRGNTHLFYYWFFTGQENYAEEWRALLNISLQKFFYGRSDGGIVEISVPLGGGMARSAAEEEAGEIIEDFTKALYPELQRLVRES